MSTATGRYLSMRRDGSLRGLVSEMLSSLSENYNIYNANCVFHILLNFSWLLFEGKQRPKTFKGEFQNWVLSLTEFQLSCLYWWQKRFAGQFLTWHWCKSVQSSSCSVLNKSIADWLINLLSANQPNRELAYPTFPALAVSHVFLLPVLIGCATCRRDGWLWLSLCFSFYSSTTHFLSYCFLSA